MAANAFLVDIITFTENCHIDKFYLPSNCDPDLIREDIKAIVDEFVVLPFTASQLTYLNYSFHI